MSQQNSVTNRSVQASGEDHLADLQRCHSFSKQLIEILPGRCVIALNGPMAIGKTQLVRFLVQEMGGAEVSSPTFALQNQYDTQSKLIYHFDLHRIESTEELEGAGLWECFSSDAWVILEWAEKLHLEDLPKEWPLLLVEYSPDRKVSWKLYAACEID